MTRSGALALAVVALAAADPARAEPVRGPRHGSVTIGGALIATGAQGDRARLEAAVDLQIIRRFSMIAAWRAVELTGSTRRGLAMVGLQYEAGAARPRLVLNLCISAGADLAARAPLAGGGLRATLGVIGPLAAVIDGGAYLIVDGIDGTRLQLQSALLVGARW